MEDIYRQHDKNKQVDMLILDFTKAFDTVPHQRLLMKLKHYGIDSNLHRWISSWLTERTQQVVVDGDYSSCKQVRSGVPQGTVGETGYGCHTFYITDVFRNMVIIADIGLLLCLNIVSCAHINMQFVIFTS